MSGTNLKLLKLSESEMQHSFRQSTDIISISCLASVASFMLHHYGLILLMGSIQSYSHRNNGTIMS